MKRLKDINWPLLAIFLVLLAMILPYAWNAHNSSKVIQEYKETTSPDVLKEQKRVSDEYNAVLNQGESLTIKDIYDQGEETAINIFNNEKPFGSVEIPSISVNLPIYEGTTERQLQLGAGHMIGSSLPTGEKNTRSVITAHRGLQTAKMFRELDKLNKGDIFFIDTYGEKKAYQVFQKTIVLPSESNSIALLEGEDIVTLLTCDPYMKNTHRLLVDGKRVAYVEEDNKVIDLDGREKEVKDRTFLGFLKSLSFVDIEYILFFVFLVLIGVRFVYKRRKEG